MLLSKLQKYILLQSLGFRKATKIDRKVFNNYYPFASLVKKDDRQGNITKSLERLIDRGLLIGFGRRTPYKWFITEISLTAQGNKIGRRLLGEQPELPFKKNKSSV